VQALSREATSLLEMGTGGGEFLASLTEFSQTTIAAEGYPPNILMAQKRLTPCGIKVLPVADNSRLPLAAESFDLIINHHESYDLPEVWRILKPQGTFLSQQVGPRNCVQLNQYLEAPWEPAINGWCLEHETTALEATGFRMVHCEEQLLDSIFLI
jgi:SAM-dependent methyltransferase